VLTLGRELDDLLEQTGKNALFEAYALDRLGSLLVEKAADALEKGCAKPCVQTAADFRAGSVPATATGILPRVKRPFSILPTRKIREFTCFPGGPCSLPRPFPG
jgi:hypothetical protein